MKKSKFTRTGTRRLGDKYQDLIALDVFLDWLEHCDRYKWVRVEANDAGFLDDVVALMNNNRIVVKQVKYSTDTDSEGDPWTWDDLLSQSHRKVKKTKS